MRNGGGILLKSKTKLLNRIWDNIMIILILKDPKSNWGAKEFEILLLPSNALSQDDIAYVQSLHNERNKDQIIRFPCKQI